MTYAATLALNTHRVDPNPMNLPAPPSSSHAGEKSIKDKGSMFYKPGIRQAEILSWCSIGATLMAVVAGLIIALETNSAATMGFAIENSVDFFSSLIVLWRFSGGGAIPAEELELREKRASVGIAISFVVLAIVCGGVALGHLIGHAEATHIDHLLALSIPSLVVRAFKVNTTPLPSHHTAAHTGRPSIPPRPSQIFSVLAVLKLWVGVATKSAAMRKDAACSACGAILSGGVVIGVLADRHSGGDVWFLDACLAMGVSVCLLIYGLLILIKNMMRGHRWWTMTFWRTPSQTTAGATAACAARDRRAAGEVSALSHSLSATRLGTRTANGAGGAEGGCGGGKAMSVEVIVIEDELKALPGEAERRAE